MLTVEFVLTFFLKILSWAHGFLYIQKVSINYTSYSLDTQVVPILVRGRPFLVTVVSFWYDSIHLWKLLCFLRKQDVPGLLCTFSASDLKLVISLRSATQCASH